MIDTRAVLDIVLITHLINAYQAYEPRSDLIKSNYKFKKIKTNFAAKNLKTNSE